jgi:hypothetical protein
LSALGAAKDNPQAIQTAVNDAKAKVDELAKEAAK